MFESNLLCGVTRVEALQRCEVRNSIFQEVI